MIAVLLDQVTAYAAAVRFHLADLTPEQVDDLTDGLEADLVEAIEDAPAGGVASPTEESSVLDLAARFGPAAEYAAEMRAAAGLEPGGEEPRRRPVREALGATGERWRTRGTALTGWIATIPGGRWLVETVPVLRPVWWLARGWVWFVFLEVPVIILVGVREPFAPSNVLAWIALIALLVLSVEKGRGHLDARRPVRSLLAVANVAAAMAVVPFLIAFADHADPDPVYIDSGMPYVEQPQDGVLVDGIYVSNLFVYDAQGNELQDVQVFDDRGRPVQTIRPESGGDWSLPGVDEPWDFAPRADVAGRDRWNVYPLLGAPMQDWTWTDSGVRELLAGRSLRMPPSPFAKAPALAGLTAETTDDSPAAAPSAPGAAASGAPTDPAAQPGAATVDPSTAAPSLPDANG